VDQGGAVLMARAVQSLTCMQCGGGFMGRADAKYCSSVCRQRAQRARNGADEQIAKILALKELQGRLQRRLKLSFPDSTEEQRLSGFLGMLFEMDDAGWGLYQR
jgi:hypothetical protein